MNERLDTILRRLAELTPQAQQRYEAETYDEDTPDILIEQVWLSLEEWYDGGTWRCGWRVKPDEATEWTIHADGFSPTEAAAKLLREMGRSGD